MSYKIECILHGDGVSIPAQRNASQSKKEKRKMVSASLYAYTLLVRMRCGKAFGVGSRTDAKLTGVFWISSKCFISFHNYQKFKNSKTNNLKACDKTRPSKEKINHKRTEGLIPCLHFSFFLKKFENLGGVKWNTCLKSRILCSSVLVQHVTQSSLSSPVKQDRRINVLCCRPVGALFPAIFDVETVHLFLELPLACF